MFPTFSACGQYRRRTARGSQRGTALLGGRGKWNCVGGAILMTLAGAVATADWSDSFPNGVPEQAWLTDSLPGFSTYTQSFFADGQQLSSDRTVADNGAQIAYAYVNESFDGSQGLRVRSVINPTPQVPEMTHTGVLAYLNPFTTSGYAVGVTWTSPAEGERTLEINKSSFGGITFLGGAGIPGFDPTQSYLIEAEVSPINSLGNQVVTARLYCAGQIAIAAGGITAADLRADILAGRNGGAWDGATGITTGLAAANPGRAVGYLIGVDGAAEVSFAAPGDVDLSGQVNVFDLVSVDAAGKYGSG
jgi:hypothetical protein